MAKQLQVFKCTVCGHVIVVIHEGTGQLVCCNEPMQAVAENSTDAAQEKHVPVIEKTTSGYAVKVGSVPHPMTDEHAIEWIELCAGGNVYRRFLKPGDAPEAIFATDATDVSARAYCNLHGLWKG